MNRFFHERFITYMAGIIKSGILPQKASQLAYSFVLSFIPLTVLLISFLGRFALPSDEVYAFMKIMLPKDAYEIVSGIIDEVIISADIGKLSVFPLIYFSSHATRAVIRTTDSVYSETPQRGGIKLYLISVIYAVLLFICIGILLVAVVFGDVLLKYFFGLFQISSSGMIWQIADIVRFLFAFFILWGFLSMVYIASPNVKLRFRQVYIGSLFSSAGWIAVSRIFGYYVNNFSGYGILFGSLGGIFILLVWLYISSYIMLVGVYINKALCCISE